jgi:hypothetical protein
VFKRTGECSREGDRGAESNHPRRKESWGLTFCSIMLDRACSLFHPLMMDLSSVLASGALVVVFWSTALLDTVCNYFGSNWSGNSGGICGLNNNWNVGVLRSIGVSWYTSLLQSRDEVIDSGVDPRWNVVMMVGFWVSESQGADHVAAGEKKRMGKI